MRISLLVLLVATAYPYGLVARERSHAPKGYVVLRSDPVNIDSVGIGPMDCFAPSCPYGVILRKGGSGALLQRNELSFEEINPFNFDPGEFQPLADYAATIRHRGLPCKMLATDGGVIPVFWSQGRKRIEINLVGGCFNRDDAPLMNLYRKIVELREVKAALAEAQRAP